MADLYFHGIFFFLDLVSGLGWTFSFASRFSHLIGIEKPDYRFQCQKFLFLSILLSLSCQGKVSMKWTRSSQVQKWSTGPQFDAIIASFALDLWSHFVNQTATDCTSTEMLEKGFFKLKQVYFLRSKAGIRQQLQLLMWDKNQQTNSIEKYHPIIFLITVCSLSNGKMRSIILGTYGRKPSSRSVIEKRT